MAVAYTNNATTTLSATITDSVTSLSVASGAGSKFPSTTGGDHFYITLTNGAGDIEIMKVTARSTDTFTVVRGQDGSSARSWSAGDKIELRLVRAMLDDLKGERAPTSHNHVLTDVTGAYTVSSSAPSSPVNGNRWLDTDTGIEYTYVNDGNTSQWVETGSASSNDWTEPGTIGSSVPNTGAFTTLSASAITDSGNLTFTGTGNRITGDFSNATFANRVLFQTSTTNGRTILGLIPNGTGDGGNFVSFNAADPTNASTMSIYSTAGACTVDAGKVGTGSYLPMNLVTGGSERVRIDTSGNVGIGTSSPGSRLHVLTPNPTAANEVARFQGGTNASNYRNYISLYTTNPNYWWEVSNEDSSGTGSTNGLAFRERSGTTSVARMYLTQGGNVGIGTSSPGARLHVKSASSGDGIFIDRSGVSAVTTLQFRNEAGAASTAILNLGTSDGMSFETGGSTERMRITSGGEVYIAGTTDRGAYNLQCNGTGVWGAGAYVNGSDARIKEDVSSLASGLDVVSKLNPVQFRYKQEWSKENFLQPGFIAQELETALDGKDYVDGVVQQGPEYMSVAYQSLIPVLTKAIQEQQEQIEQMSARLAALEGN